MSEQTPVKPEILEQMPDSENIEVDIGDKKVKGKWYNLGGFALILVLAFGIFFVGCAVVIKVAGIQIDAFGVKVNAEVKK